MYCLSNELKEKIREKSYLGKKGYTVPKDVLTVEENQFLRKDLLMLPIQMGNYGGAASATSAFPVFRESDKKIYLPRFYGVERYGLPSRSDLDDGNTISLTFDKPLRDYQNHIVGVYTDYVADQPNGAILEVPCGRGKCLAKDTMILLFDGSLKPVQDIVVGDQLMGDDSTCRTVLSLASGKEMMFQVKGLYDNGYTVNQSHILSLKHSITGQVLDMSVEDYLAFPDKDLFWGYRVPITFPHIELGPEKLDPYQYGEISASMTSFPLEREYKCNSRHIQLEVLAGIVDNLGFVTEHEYSIQLAAYQTTFAEEILFLLRSLGIGAVPHVSKAHIIIQMWSTDHIHTNEIPIRRLYNFRTNINLRLSLSYPIQVRSVGVDQYYGFEIDGNRRFVLGDFVVTHNTVMALKIISEIQKKTLIIVHKEFLMNQWIERISEFLPMAKVGKIQGPTFDIAEKDIAIGMVQTLYDKDFGPDAFSSFGLTIIDEVHRIGSEQFSRTLMKTITPYMLGISATVDRKDGLTKVLHMFIGNKIYSEERKDQDLVQVRAIQYKCQDSEFNETELDYRGKPKFSTMIVKLCSFGPRSDLIVKVLADLLKESSNQIMVLCHNRSLLTYLHGAIGHRIGASVGFYVGGMKIHDLQETEEKQIVLATYAMAAEALDIKTLSTLVMVTPKTDIIQSVGRILRVKHDNPIIVDIIDSHSIFQNQWTQRKRYYRKCNYHIVQVDSTAYRGMEDRDHWKTVYHPVAAVAQKDDDGGDEIKETTTCLIRLDDEET